MSQNISSAVMQQRREPSDSFDYFPTPLWATRALCAWLADRLDVNEQTVLEPACGEGHMARALSEYFGDVKASDIQDMGYGSREDYLFAPLEGQRPHWVITNPPFRLASQFIEKARRESMVGCAMLVRTSFLESASRYEGLFRDTPPSHVLQYAERVPMFKGRVDAKGSTATSYCWLIWQHAHARFQTVLEWIPPSRKKLERDGDWA